MEQRLGIFLTRIIPDMVFFMLSATLYTYMEVLYYQILWIYVPAIFFYTVVSYDLSWFAASKKYRF